MPVSPFGWQFFQSPSERVRTKVSGVLLGKKTLPGATTGEHEDGLTKEAAKLPFLDVFRDWAEGKILIFLSIYCLPKSA